MSQGGQGQSTALAWPVSEHRIGLARHQGLKGQCLDEGQEWAGLSYEEMGPGASVLCSCALAVWCKEGVSWESASTVLYEACGRVWSRMGVSQGPMCRATVECGFGLLWLLTVVGGPRSFSNWEFLLKHCRHGARILYCRWCSGGAVPLHQGLPCKDVAGSQCCLCTVVCDSMPHLEAMWMVRGIASQ